MQPTREDTFGTQPNRMATFDLRDGTVGEDVVAPIWTDVSSVTDAGDGIVAGGTHTNYSSRARRRPAETWGPLHCFTTTPPAQVATSFKVVAGQPAWVDVKPAVDPEAS